MLQKRIEITNCTKALVSFLTSSGIEISLTLLVFQNNCARIITIDLYTNVNRFDFTVTFV